MGNIPRRFCLYCFNAQDYVLCLVAQICPTLYDPMDCSPSGSSVHGVSLGKNTGVGCHALLQGIFPIQGWNPGILHCRPILYCLSCQGSPRILEWIAYPFYRESSHAGIRPGSPALPMDSLPSELPRRTIIKLKLSNLDEIINFFQISSNLKKIKAS